MSGGDRAEFLDIWQQHVTRPGSEKLLDWLDKKTDFFTAPASTRFHGACEGGLCMHSLNVYHALHDSFFTEGESEESYAICALLHDLCKANYYKLGTRNVKNEATGQWEKAPFYSVDDLFPYGHGEKSVFLIERFMKLKVEEAVAIRWHMGGFDDAARGGCFAISEAYDKYPLAVKLHIADLQATYLMEHRTSNMRLRTKKRCTVFCATLFVIRFPYCGTSGRPPDGWLRSRAAHRIPRQCLPKAGAPGGWAPVPPARRPAHAG